MPKNLLEDMVKVKRATRKIKVIQDEPVPEVKVKKIDRPNIIKTSREGKKGPRYALWCVAGVSIVFFLFAFSLLFLNVSVNVNPKTQDVVLNENFSATVGGGTDTLPFDLVVISGEENKIVPTTLEKDVSEKAKGVVSIYNAFSSAPQKLTIETRLEGSNGKIYKTDKAIVVPGMKGSTPGSVEVGIHATDAGLEYNSTPLDFKIFGFKGTTKYAKFYGRSIGDITGGFKGKASVVSDAEKQTITDDLKKNLQAKLIQKATGQIPVGFILFKDGVFLDMHDAPGGNNFTSSADKTFTVNLTGTLYGFIFNEEKLTKKITEAKIKKDDTSVLYIPNIRNLTFSLSNKDNVSFADLKNINFNLKGTAKVVWRVDESKLVTDLLGKSKKDFNEILLQYPDVDSASLEVSPFWKMSLPSKADDIHVIVNYPK